MATFLEVKNLLKDKIAEGLEVVVANAAINYFDVAKCFLKTLTNI